MGDGNGVAMVRQQGGLAMASADPEIVEMAIINGDLAKLSAEERTSYYMRTCESLGLNPYTRPFEYIVLNGKLTFYARRDCAEQLRKLNRVSVRILSREVIHDDIYVVTAQATLPDGRQDESTGVVSLGRLQGEALANAYMKAETKAKRRVTLSICGLGWLDETEVESISGARHVEVEGGPPPAPPSATDDDILKRRALLVEDGVACASSTNGRDMWRKRAEEFFAWCRANGVARQRHDSELVLARETIAQRVGVRKTAPMPSEVLSEPGDDP